MVNGGIEEQDETEPRLGAHVGDRCALSGISLALDQGDATALLAVTSPVHERRYVGSWGAML